MTTRQFQLGSRAGWIETHHVDFRDNTFSVPKEGLISVGPADYSPSEVKRHVSTPNLGGSQSRIAHLLPTSFGEQSRLSPPRHGSPKQSWRNRLEQPTIFHDYQTRQPIDVNRRYCLTPAASIVENSVFEKVNTDGKRVLHKIDFTKEERFFKTYPSLVVEYHDVRYDSSQIKKKPPLGSIPRARRLPIRLSEHEPILEHESQIEHASRMNSVAPPSPPAQSRLAPVSQPKIKKRYTGPTVVFDSSCYSNQKKGLHFEISPGSIAKAVPKNIFGNVYAVPKLHKSRPLDHSINLDDVDQ